MKKWNLIIDVDKCNGCFNCFLACKDEYINNDYPGYSAPQPLHGHKWIDIKTVEKAQAPFTCLTYVPTMCNHCDKAPCVAAGNGAVNKRADGIVIIDPVKAKGKKDIVDSCPYGAIYWNEELEIPQAWTFDAHLLDQGWDKPRCEPVCAMGAIKSALVEDDEMAKIIETEGLEPIDPNLDTKPRVHYKNLFRVNKMFICGTVTSEKDGVVDSVEGANISLHKDNGSLGEVHTDNFGDFKIDKLEPEAGQYKLVIEADGYPTTEKEIDVADSIYVGEIRLAE